MRSLYFILLYIVCASHGAYAHGGPFAPVKHPILAILAFGITAGVVSYLHDREVERQLMRRLR